MKKFKAIVWVTVIILTFSLGVAAQEDSHRASVEKLLQITDQDQLLEQIYPQIKQLILGQVQQLDVPQEQTPLIEEYFDKIFNVMKEEMAWDNIKDDFIQLYMSVYTEAEINELIAFYESPVGQKTLEKMPLIMQESMAISQKYTMKMMPKILEIAEEMTAKIENASN